MNKLATIIITSILLCSASPLLAEDKATESTYEEWYIGPRFGISPWTGFLLGMEFQKKHHAIGVGILAMGYRYYFEPYRSSPYAGACVITGYTTEHKLDNAAIVGGGGYRWRFGSGWDLDLGVAAGIGTKYRNEYITAPDGRRFYKAEEKYYGLTFAPSIAFGYSF